MLPVQCFITNSGQIHPKMFSLFLNHHSIFFISKFIFLLLGACILISLNMYIFSDYL